MPDWRRSLANDSSWASSLALAAGLALSCAACTRGPAVLSIGRIVVDAPREFDDPSTVRESIRAKVSESLKRDPTVRFVAGGAKATHVLRLSIGAGVATNSGEVRPVQVDLRPVGSGLAYSASGRASTDGDRASTVFAAFQDAWAVLGRVRVLDAAKDDELLARLDDEDMRIRQFAIVRLGERKAPGAVEPLCRLLTSESRPELVLHAVGALVAIGDKRAVAPLIELTRHKDPAFVLQIVFALGALGGPTAQGYLVTLASGHPDDGVRQAAEDALAEMPR